MGNGEKKSDPWPYFCAWRGSYILGSGNLPPATYWRRWEERIMDHGRTHVKAWLLWVDEKVKQKKRKERTKKENESKVS
jgi:hypothetical protein